MDAGAPQPVLPQEPQIYTPVEAMVFEFNGQRVTTDSKDTLILQEEGVRSLKFIGFEPSNATDISIARVDSINFYHDLYTFNYKEDSIIIKTDTRSALPDNYYISHLNGDFEQFCAITPQQGVEISFYNYVNKNADFTTIQLDSGNIKLHWEDLGKYRLYRLEFMAFVGGDGGVRSFSLPFYEKRNRVDIVADTIYSDGVPHIKIAPGESIKLQFIAEVPQEFTIYEWSKGVATERFEQLNGENVEGAWSAQMRDTLLTEDGMRYTNSKIHLTPDGILTLDKGWSKEGATASGGGIYSTIPISVIVMPSGNEYVGRLSRSFTFPNGHTILSSPNPIYCNGVVEIIYD